MYKRQLQLLSLAAGIFKGFESTFMLLYSDKLSTALRRISFIALAERISPSSTVSYTHLDGLLMILNDDKSSFVGFHKIFWRLGGALTRLPALLKSI